LLAEQDGIDRRLVAGSVFLMLGQTVFYAFTGWRRADHSLRANDLIHWDAIQDARAQGFRYYDFGEVADGQEGLAGFKTKWGSEPRQLYRYLYPVPGRVAFGIAESGRAPRLVRAAWPRLPLRATALIGDWFYSYL
jgi:CelD/BcsL family acetyltransferase involved in cellulose biosynthesis